MTETARSSRAWRAARRAGTVVLGLLLATAAARADPVPPRATRPLAEVLEVRGVSPCLAPGTLAEEVEEWLGRDRVDARLRVRVDALADRSVFSISLGSATPHARAFPELPADCEAQRRTVALSIALAIDALAPAAPGRSIALRPSISVDVVASTPWPAGSGLGGAVSLGIAPLEFLR
ncbi:MAG: hypothetical protein FJ104_08845, partial [Deltaproteobacteria bacterium]|nr:hypothetical protein [Deltaproteobacteria bacterium]